MIEVLLLLEKFPVGHKEVVVKMEEEVEVQDLAWAGGEEVYLLVESPGCPVKLGEHKTDIKDRLWPCDLQECPMDPVNTMTVGIN